MIKENLSELYENLIKEEFAFLGQGEFELRTIYSKVKDRYPDLCDDNFMCIQCCKNGNKNDPEWHHRIRAALGSLKDAGRNVKKGVARNFWKIG
jgi:hypothetical protein